MYIIYKLLNNLFFNIIAKKIPYPSLYSTNSILPFDCIYFDFNHKTTHFGDKLFFLKIVRLLRLNNLSVIVLDSSGSFNAIYNYLYSCPSPSLITESELITGHKNRCIHVALKPSFLSFYLKKNNLLIVDLTDLRINKKLPEQLVFSIGSLFNVNLEKKLDFNIDSTFSSVINRTDKFVIFNNYIDSGKFRKFFLSEKLLNEKCIYLKEQGFKIYHVGSINDKNKDVNYYDFVDFDYRGSLNIIDLMSLFNSRKFVIVVSYDNFLMHLGCIFGRQLFVLFRGRFTKSQRNHHYNYINNSFESFDDQISYLYDDTK